MTLIFDLGTSLLETVKNFAKRIESYAIHLELERKNDAFKINKLKDDLYSCEMSYKKLKSQNDETSKINERLKKNSFLRS